MRTILLKVFQAALILAFSLAPGAARAALPAETGPEAGLEWQVQRVVDLHYLSPEMGDHAAVFDSQGVMHVAYGGDHLYYARCENASCIVETVDASDYVGAYASLALDSLGRPRIAYYDTGLMDFCDDEKVKYAAWDGSQWVIEVVEVGCTGKYPSLAVDKHDVAHISFYDEVSDSLKLADWDGTAWNTYTPAWLPNFEFSGHPSSLLADADGDLHLAFVAGHPGEATLWYTEFSGGAWSPLAEVDAQSGVSTLALALDGNGKPHLSYNVNYYDAGLSSYVNKLRYTRLDGANWLAPVELDDVEYLGWTSITVGTDGFPHIAYKTAGDIVAYISKAALGWGLPMPVPDSAGAQRIYAGHSSNNQMGLTLYAHGALHYTTSNPPAFAWPSPMEIDRTRWMGEHLALAYTPAGDLHIVYNDETDQRIFYAHRPVGGSWQFEPVVTLTGGLTVRDLDIQLDSDGFPHIVYQEYDPVYQRSVLKYLQWTGSLWLDWGVVNQPGHNGCAPALALDSFGTIYIAYNDCDYIHENLTLAIYNGSWSYQTVDADGGTSGASIQVTDDGFIYISYSLYDYPNSLVRYAHKEGSVDWVIDDVTPAGPGDTSLALDQSGKPRIAYVYEVFPDYEVEFAWWDGQGWFTETLSSSPTPNAARLRLDSQDRPHVAYVCWGAPCYAVKDGGVWTRTEPIDRPPADPDLNFGRTYSVGLGFGSQGLPLLAYDGEMDLKLAELVEVEDTWWVFMPALGR